MQTQDGSAQLAIRVPDYAKSHPCESTNLISAMITYDQCSLSDLG